MSDATVLIRDIAGDAAQNAASTVKPDEEQLQKIDEPAPDNTWHDAPDLSKDNIKSQIQAKSPIGKNDAKKAAGDVTQAAHPDGSRDPADAANLAQSEAQAGDKSTSLDANAAAASAKQKVSENVDEDQKQKAREYREKTNEYFKKKVPKERREQTIYRLYVSVWSCRRYGADSVVGRRWSSRFRVTPTVRTPWQDHRH